MTDVPKKKRKKPVSMTAKARELCRLNGWHYGQVDQRIPGTFIARDLFGMFDAVVIDNRAGRGLLGVQVTSGDNHAARAQKIRDNPLMLDWILAGGRIEVWSWRRIKPRGQKRPTWDFRCEAISASSVLPSDVATPERPPVPSR